MSTGSEFSPEQRHELRESLVTMLECLTGDDEELNMRDRTTLLKRRSTRAFAAAAVVAVVVVVVVVGGVVVVVVRFVLH